ncbi:MAG: class II aldolase/adducin family protein [Actinobacteria bacterium]|nr:class II aldolase/adducin family protein [Thermoleophilia bacterium]MCB9011500.1 class II aldolase/adducin family protein [Actinomycetota bacterium]
MTVDDIRSLRREVAAACRVLATEGYSDLTLGHVSARMPGQDAVLIKRKGVALAEVTADDVVMVDLDARPLEGDAEIHLETSLHTEVYRARPDVGAVVHGHPLHATALAATDARLEMLSHDAVLFADGLPRYDASPDLVTSAEEGAAVARVLGTCRAVLMRNHGVLVAGKDVPWAVLTAATLERAAEIQALAGTLGGALTPMSIEDARRLAPAKYRDAFAREYWDAWLRQVGG